MRVILVPLSGSDHDRSALGAAEAIARHLYGPHLEVLFVRPDPLELLPMVGDGMSAETVETISREAAATYDQRRAAAKQRFHELVKAGKVTLADYPTSSDTISARWRQVVGHAGALVAAHGRLADLIVLSGIQDKAEPDRAVAFETALLTSARPILVVPEQLPVTLGAVVAVAWNGSPEAVRAVAGALPLLKTADAVHVLTAATQTIDAGQCQQAADYLAWHGITTERHVLHPTGDDVGTPLLERAREVGADLLVMGGYGRSRMREMIFGGVTFHATTTLELPLLLAH